MSGIALNPVAHDVATCAQLQPEHMPAVADAGFKTVINNRPDFEGGPDQPSSESMAAAAQAAGLVYHYLPVQGAYQSPEQIAAFADLLRVVPHPVLAFCRSGARSARLYALATDGE